MGKHRLLSSSSGPERFVVNSNGDSANGYMPSSVLVIGVACIIMTAVSLKSFIFTTIASPIHVPASQSYLSHYHSCINVMF